VVSCRYYRALIDLYTLLALTLVMMLMNVITILEALSLYTIVCLLFPVERQFVGLFACKVTSG